MTSRNPSYLIIGAGVFGVSTAYHLIQKYPNASVTSRRFLVASQRDGLCEDSEMSIHKFVKSYVRVPVHLIIGAGVFGVSTAYHLIQKYPNASVTLVDRDAYLFFWSRRFLVASQRDGLCEDSEMSIHKFVKSYVRSQRPSRWLATKNRRLQKKRCRVIFEMTSRNPSYPRWPLRRFRNVNPQICEIVCASPSAYLSINQESSWFP
jgi:hypothetical protein